MKNKRISHEAFKKELIADEDFLKAYDELEEEYQLMREMLKARKEAKVSQKKLADLMHTTQSAVSRIENLDLGKGSPSFATIKKYAHALNHRVVVKFEKIEEQGRPL